MRVLTTVIVVCSVSICLGADLYVDQTHPSAADDPSHGSLSAPWATISYAAAQVDPGDTVYVRSGIYNEQVSLLISGGSSTTITFAAFPGETPVIDGSGLSLVDYSGLLQIVDAEYIEVRGFRVQDAEANGAQATISGIQVENSSSIAVRDNSTYNTASSGIIVWGSSDVLVDGNDVEFACAAGAISENEGISVGETTVFEISNNTVHDGSPIRGEGIDAKDGSSNGSIHHNHVHNVMSVGIYIDAWDKTTSNIDIYSNRVHDIQGDGFSVGSEQGGSLSNIRFFNNIAFNNSDVGLSIHSCCIASHPVANLQVINNTFVNNGYTDSNDWGGGILDENGQATDAVIRNNLCFANEDFQIALELAHPGDVAVDHNLVYPYRGYYAETRGDSYQESDPLFVDATAFDFHLRPGSPALDNGSATAAPAEDFDGVGRPIGAAFDIGAYEGASTAIFSDDFETAGTSAWSSTVL